MADAPVRVPDNFDELQERLRNGWVKGKAAGASNTALMNTSMMLVKMFQENEKNKITPYQQAVLDQQKERFEYFKEQEKDGTWTLVDTDGDGVMEWVNSKTKTIETTGAGSDLGKYEEGTDPSNKENASETGEKVSTPNGQTFSKHDLQIDEGGYFYTNDVGQKFYVDVNAAGEPIMESASLEPKSTPEKNKAEVEARMDAKAREEALKKEGAFGVYSQPVSEAVVDSYKDVVTSPWEMIPGLQAPGMAAEGAANAGKWFVNNALPKAKEFFFGEEGPRIKP